MLHTYTYTEQLSEQACIEFDKGERASNLKLAGMVANPENNRFWLHYFIRWSLEYCTKIFVKDALVCHISIDPKMQSARIKQELILYSNRGSYIMYMICKIVLESTSTTSILHTLQITY